MVIVITGPTATGKTDLGIYLAHKLNGEIINADSTQIYKGLDIATNKVQDTEGIVHHLFNEKDLREDYSVFDYQKDARVAIDDILARGKVPILVGGTGLYINAALYDYKFEDKAKDIYDLGIRSKAVMTPIGPKELFDYFDGKISLEEAIDLIKSKSRKYAKRQYTWFRGQMNLKWFETNYDDFSKTEEEVLKYVEKKMSK